MSVPRDLLLLFLDHAACASAATASDGGLEQAIEVLLAKAQQGYPLPPEELPSFVVHVAARLPEEQAAALSLARCHAGDLALAFACTRGNEAARRELEARHFSSLTQLLRRKRFSPAVADDCLQLLREELYLGQSASGLSRYRGEGPLGGFLRLIALRFAYRACRRELPKTEEPAVAAPVPPSELERQLTSAPYGFEVSRAIRRAFRELPAQERALLRYRFVDGLTLQHLGRICGSHHATVSRRIDRLCAALLEAAKAELEARLGIGDSTLESIVRGAPEALLELSLFDQE